MKIIARVRNCLCLIKIERIKIMKWLKSEDGKIINADKVVSFDIFKMSYEKDNLAYRNEGMTNSHGNGSLNEKGYVLLCVTDKGRYALYSTNRLDKAEKERNRLFDFLTGELPLEHPMNYLIFNAEE